MRKRGGRRKMTVSAELSGKPLLRLRTPVNLAIYRAEVEPFDALRYVDLAKLAKAPRATVELGVVRTPAGTDTLVAEVRRGEIVGLGPQHCSGCSGKGKLPEKRMRDALTRVTSKLGPKEGVTLPMPITTVLGPRGLRAPLRPLIIKVVTQQREFVLRRVEDEGRRVVHPLLYRKRALEPALHRAGRDQQVTRSPAPSMRAASRTING